MELTAKQYENLRSRSTQELETLLRLSVSGNRVTEAEIWAILEILAARTPESRSQDTDAAWEDFSRREAAGFTPRSRGPAKRLRHRLWPLAAVIAAVIVLCTSAAFALEDNTMPQWLAQLLDSMASTDRHYSAIEEDARLTLNETRTCEQQNLSMTVEEMILEDRHLLVQANFRHLSGEEEVLSTSELPWDVMLYQDGTEIFYADSESISATTVNDDSDDRSILYTIDLGALDGGTLLNRELTVSFVYTRGGEVNPEAGSFDFTVTPTQCVQELRYEVGREYTLSQGTIYVDSVEEDALHIKLNAQLRCPERENQSCYVSLQTENGLYEADAVQSGETCDSYLFPRLQDGSDSLTFAITSYDLTLADANGTLLPEAEQELGRFTVPLE